MNTYLITDAISKTLVRATSEVEALEIVGSECGLASIKLVPRDSNLMYEIGLRSEQQELIDDDNRERFRSLRGI